MEELEAASDLLDKIGRSHDNERRFIMAFVVELDVPSMADELLDSITDALSHTPVVNEVAHACVRQLEPRRTCPECEEQFI